MVPIFSSLVILTALLTSKICQCAVVIFNQPQDAIANVGATVYFNCNYTGTFSVPLWFIEGRGYSVDELPSRHSYSSRRLSVSNVQLTDSGNTYQCSFVSPASRIATLTVLRPGATLSLPDDKITTLETAAETTPTTVVTIPTTAFVMVETTPIAAETTPETITAEDVSLYSEAMPQATISGSLTNNSTKTQKINLAIACVGATAGVVILLVFFGILGVFISRVSKRPRKLSLPKSPETTEPEYAVIANIKPTDGKYEISVNTCYALGTKDPCYEELGHGIKINTNDAYGRYIGTKSQS